MAQLRAGWLVVRPLAPASLAAQQAGAPYTHTANARLVTVDVAAHDKNGVFLRNLTPADLTLFEDGKPQTIASAATERALPFVKTQMRPADLVAIATLGDQLEVAQEFTADRDTPLAALTGLHEQTLHNAAPHRFDEQRSLLAIKALCKSLGVDGQKKSLVVFFHSIGGTGFNLRDAETAALGSNTSVYAWDACGLAGCMSAPGDRSSGARGPIAAIDAQLNSSESMHSLAVDTGGALLLNSNDPTPLLAQVENDTSSYYVITYYTANAAMDGHQRHITVRTRIPGATLDYRELYYGPKDFAHLDADERKEQLWNEAIADEPEQSLPVEAIPAISRGAAGKYHLAVQINLAAASKPANATVDVVATVEDGSGKVVGEEFGSIAAGPGRRYTANFELPQGLYRVSVAARADPRDNQDPKMGAVTLSVPVR